MAARSKLRVNAVNSFNVFKNQNRIVNKKMAALVTAIFLYYPSRLRTLSQVKNEKGWNKNPTYILICNSFIKPVIEKI